MKIKDYLIVALAPTPALLTALLGNMCVAGWNWNSGSFVFTWVVIAGATFLYRLLATGRFARFPYRLAAGLTVLGIRDQSRYDVFNRQKTMYGGKRIAAGEAIFIFASENWGNRPLRARNRHGSQGDSPETHW